MEDERTYLNDGRYAGQQRGAERGRHVVLRGEHKVETAVAMVNVRHAIDNLTRMNA